MDAEKILKRLITATSMQINNGTVWIPVVSEFTKNITIKRDAPLKEIMCKIHLLILEEFICS